MGEVFADSGEGLIALGEGSAGEAGLLDEGFEILREVGAFLDEPDDGAALKLADELGSLGGVEATGDDEAGLGRKAVEVIDLDRSTHLGFQGQGADGRDKNMKCARSE